MDYTLWMINATRRLLGLKHFDAADEHCLVRTVILESSTICDLLRNESPRIIAQLFHGAATKIIRDDGSSEMRNA